MDPSALEIVLRLVVAAGGAGILGWQRERHDKPAGLRTQMLVGVGAALFTMITLRLYQAVPAADEMGRMDPLRVVQGVIQGIGFLGAGSIIQSRGSVKGITTAATIWVVGGLGVACGLGYYFLAGLAVVLAMTILSAVGYLEKRYLKEETAQQDSSG